MEAPISVPLVNLVAVIAMMIIGWIISLVQRNVTVVDTLWGLGFVLVASITYWLGSGFPHRSLLVLTLTAAWGLRLAVYLTHRNWGQEEDHRYGSWRAQSGSSFWIVSLFKVFLLQAIFLWTISLVLQKAQLSAAPNQLTLLDLTGVIVWTIGFIFEVVGDRQLARFKADPSNQGRVMDHGLWAWSRHPNYFGEFLIWWGFFIIALATPGGWWTLFSPVIITVVLLKLTGVPLTEAALKKRRPGYSEYIARTSPFFPRPPKKEAR
ncbi:MAG: DUF1295 domain-containing protein [Desulfosarcina sp.]|jgi:steroid 5-alpha reductase family enzyme